MDYNNFTIKDFILDEYFQEWVLQPHPEISAFWETWLAKHPEKAETITSAREIVLALQFQEQEPAEARVKQIWEAIAEANAASDVSPAKLTLQPAAGHVIKLPLWQEWSRMAAAVLLLMAVSFIMYNQINSKTEQGTAFGQTKTIVLPDNSKVILNANSKITYSKSWDADEKREVWLEGEAFFSVVHTDTDQKFIVHTSDKVNVEVLGTTFDVLRRHNNTRIVLNTGKIRLNLGQDKKQKQIMMAPGELVEFKQEPLAYVKKKVDPARFSSWTKNKLVFDGTPLYEVVTILKENYGLAVTVADTTLLQKKLWGSVPSNDTGLLLAALSNSFDLTIRQKENQVQLSARLKDKN